MVERFKETVDIQSVPVSTGAAQGMMSLVDKLESFKHGMMGIAAQEWTRQAQERGTKRAQQTELVKKDGVTQAPEFEKVGFIGGIEAATYNKTLKNSYISSLNRDIRENVSRIQAENQEDLLGFNTSIESFRESLLGSTDPAVRGEAATLIDDVVTSSRIQVQKNSIQKNIEDSKIEQKLSADKTLDDALTHASNNDYYGASSSLIEYNKDLARQVESGFLSESEAAEKSRDAVSKITMENMIGSIRILSGDGEYDKAINIISKTRESVPKGITVDEHQSLISGMIAELNEAINLGNKAEKTTDDQLKSFQKSNYSDLTIGIAEGTTDLRTLTNFLKNKKITPEQYDRLVGTLNSRGRGVDDYALINQINDDIYNLGTGDTELTADDISISITGNMGAGLTDKTASDLMKQLRLMEDKEFVLNQPVVKRARDFITPSIRIVGIMGAFDTEAEQRRATALRVFDERVLAGEDPWAVADDLVGKDRLEREPQPMYGSKDDLEQAINKLQDAVTAGAIDKATYNYESKLINKLQQLKQNIATFEEAKKNAQPSR